jgi:uncharacterized small protein (TIGR04563 family)
VSQKRKVTLYFNSAMLAETQKEAIRQDRSVSWIIQAAWRIAREEIHRMPASGMPQTADESVLAATDTLEAELSETPTPLPHLGTSTSRRASA